MEKYNVFIAMTVDQKDWRYSIKQIKCTKSKLFFLGKMIELSEKDLSVLKEKEEKNEIEFSFLSRDAQFSQETLASDIQEMLTKYIPDQPDVFFIGDSLRRIERELRKYLLNRSCGVAFNKTFAVSKTKVHRTDGQQAFEGMDDFSGMEFQSVKKDNASNDVETTKKTDKSYKVPKRKNDIKKEKDENREPAPKKPEIVNDVENNVEDKIFEPGKQENEIRKASFSAVQDAKAGLVYYIQERLQKHILNRLGKEGKGLTDSDLFQLILMLINTEKLEEFSLSWKSIQPYVDLTLKEEDYNILKAEANYYSKLTDMLYEEDKWKK